MRLELHHRALTPQARSLAEYHRRRAEYLEGATHPDPRDQEQRDQGVELEWRAAVIRRERRPAPVTIDACPLLRLQA